MTSSERVDVKTDDLRKHSKAVEELAGRADYAADAAAHVTTLDDAYGVFCMQFGIMLKIPQLLGTQALRNSGKTLHTMASKLDKTSDGYDECDRKFADKLTEILKQAQSAIERGGQR